MKFLAGALIFSSMLPLSGRRSSESSGAASQIYDFRGSAFDQIGLQEGDTILEIDGKKVGSLEDIGEKFLNTRNSRSSRR